MRWALLRAACGRRGPRSLSFCVVLEDHQPRPAAASPRMQVEMPHPGANPPSPPDPGNVVQPKKNKSPTKPPARRTGWPSTPLGRLGRKKLRRIASPHDVTDDAAAPADFDWSSGPGRGSGRVFSSSDRMPYGPKRVLFVGQRAVIQEVRPARFFPRIGGQEESAGP